MAKKRRTYRIDIRDQRIPGGRFTASARTSSAPEFRRREAAVRALIEAGEWALLSRISAPGEDRLHVAEVARAVAEGALDRLRLGHAAPLTMGATGDRLLQTKDATRSAGTYRQVRVVLRQLEAHFGVERKGDAYPGEGEILRDAELRPITRAECEAWLHGPQVDGKPWAPRTQVVKHAYAKQLWDLAIRDEAEAAEKENRKPRLTRNPWRDVEPAPVVPTRVIYLTGPERDALLRTIAGTPACALMAVGYLAGLRISEARHLRAGIDVDLDAGVLRIQNRDGSHAWTTKTLNAPRDVPINDTLRAILEEHVRRGYAGRRYFFRSTGRDVPLGEDTARNWWTAAYDAAGIKWGRDDSDAVVYHTGRHTFASLLVQQGVSPLIVAELMGDTYQEVIDTYGHLAPHNLRDAIRLLESGPVSAESSTETKGDE